MIVTLTTYAHACEACTKCPSGDWGQQSVLSIYLHMYKYAPYVLAQLNENL